LLINAQHDGGDSVYSKSRLSGFTTSLAFFQPQVLFLSHKMKTVKFGVLQPIYLFVYLLFVVLVLELTAPMLARQVV
jgi:hypothetical protein